MSTLMRVLFATTSVRTRLDGSTAVVGSALAMLFAATLSAQPDPSAGSLPNFAGTYDGADEIIEPEPYPFTRTGRRAHEAYDSLVDDPRQGDDCAPESMPSVVWAGTISNMRLTQLDDRLEFYYEHGGTLRTVHMNAEPPAAGTPYTPLGYSRGHWEGNVLVIETTHLDSGVIFTLRGYPITRDARLVERYSRRDNGDLLMELTVHDPVNYTQPITFTRNWVWTPDQEALPWNCVSLGPRDGEPDIDALRELLKDL